MGINISSKKLYSRNELIDNQFVSVFGKSFDIIKNELNEEKEKKGDKYITEIEQISIVGRKYGNGNLHIYLVGPCIVNGFQVLEKDSLVYLLHEYLEKIYLHRYSIIGIPITEEKFDEKEQVLNKLLTRENDIVILIDERTHLIPKSNSTLNQDAIDLNLKDLYDMRPLDGPWFSDTPIHTNVTGNRAIAKEIFDKILNPCLSTIDFDKIDEDALTEPIQMTKKEKEELDKYIGTIQLNKFITTENNKVGAIVMNCNPITKGHLYLIDEASKQVDYLYIFIVEEDRSFFPFKDRMSLVSQAVSNYENIKVFPSGNFILSYNTLPSYFQKDEVQNVTIDATLDIKIFCQFITPALNINIRFVGEEPLDHITNQYNREMERSLGRYNIEFKEIQRKESDEEVISASRVRKLLKDKDFDEIKKIVPNCTYEYLINNFFK